MPKRENSVVVTASADVEANIAAICYHLGLDPRAHGSGQKAIREALTIAVTVLAARQQPPPASDRGGDAGEEK